MKLKHLLRTVTSEPGFVIAFIVTLGLGIGANTAIFSLVSGVLLRPLPYPDAERLLLVRQASTIQGQDDVNFSFVEIDDYRQQSTTIDQFVEFGDWTFNVLDRGEPHRAVAGLVTANFFDVLGMRPLHGRTFEQRDEDRNAAPVAVLTHGYWQRALGGDPNVIGEMLNLTSESAEIVGVLAPAAHYAAEGRRQDFYANYASNDHYTSATMQDDRNHRMTTVYARLAEGATLAQARADLTRISRQLHTEYPEDYPEDLGLETVADLWQDQLVGKARPMLWAILGGSFLVLLIACANVANLTLVRGLRRTREMSIRAALGGSARKIRGALFRESLVLALCGAAVGVAIAYALLDVLIAYASRLTTRTDEIAIDVRVLAATLLIAVGCAVVFSLLPGLAPTKRLAEALSGGGGGRTAGSPSRSKSQRILVVSQLAVSFLLVFGSLLLGRTLLNLYSVDPGYELDQVLSVEAPKFSQVPRSEHKRFTDGTIEQVGTIAGVDSVAMTRSAPLGGASTFPLKISVRGGIEGEDARAQPTLFETVTAGFFDTLGIPMVRGREFTDRDREDGERVAVVNQSAAKFYFGEDDPIGRQIAYDFGGFFAGQSEWLTIIGVAADTRVTGIAETGVHALYLPEAQAGPPDTVLVRTEHDPQHVAAQVLETLRALDPERPLEHMRTLAEVRDESVAPWRLNALLFGSFAGLALLIAGVGVAAMLMWSVGARSKELAIRAAVGAEPGKLLRSVLLEGSILVAIGLGIGAIAAVASSRWLESLLFEVEPADATTLVTAAGVLVVLGLVGALLPAVRAMRTNPIELLRSE